MSFDEFLSLDSSSTSVPVLSGWDPSATAFRDPFAMVPPEISYHAMPPSHASTTLPQNQFVQNAAPTAFQDPSSWEVPAMTLQSLLSEDTTVEEAARRIIHNIDLAHNPTSRRHRFWRSFLASVVSSQRSHGICLELLVMLQEHWNNAAVAQRFDFTASSGSQWHVLRDFRHLWYDMYRILRSQRDLYPTIADNRAQNITPESGLPLQGDCNSYMRFIKFSIEALKRGAGHVNPYFIFEACRDVLDCKIPVSRTHRLGQLSSEELYIMDVNVASAWLNSHAHALFFMDQSRMPEAFAIEMRKPQELWPDPSGLTQSRWVHWGHKLQEIAEGRVLANPPPESFVSRVEEMRSVARTASWTINRLLDRHWGRSVNAPVPTMTRTLDHVRGVQPSLPASKPRRKSRQEVNEEGTHQPPKPKRRLSDHGGLMKPPSSTKKDQRGQFRDKKHNIR